jgi:hypothetical protein
VIQVLLAEVQLDNIEEFGVEMGLQDSILFDRSAAGAGTSAGTNVPGFLFNNQPLGNGNTPTALTNPQLVGGQALSTFGVQRTNSGLGYGGLVLSASSESVSVLIRALRECRRLEVLSRPQIMTLDNQPAQIQVGQRVARVTGTSVNSNASTTNVADEDVGLILGVVPRITPDGLVVMEIRATKSEMGSEAEGTPISVSISGQILRQPPINITTAETTVATPNGQTVILGGLITKTKSVTRRRTPWLSDVPVLGNLFRFDSESIRRTELLIIMTPHVVRNRDDLDAIKQVEAARMHWCLGDVVDVHGDPGVRGAVDTWTAADTRVVYPDLNPDGSATSPQDVPSTPQPTGPEGGPIVPETIPTPPAMPDESASAAPQIRPDDPRIGPGVLRPFPAATQVQMRPIEEAYLHPASGASLPASYSVAQPVVYPAAYPPVNPAAYPPVNPAVYQPVNPAAYQPVNPVTYPVVSPVAYPPAFPPTPPAATLNGVQPAVYQGPGAPRTPAFQTPAPQAASYPTASYPTVGYPTAGTYPGPAVATANLPNPSGPVVASIYQTPAYQPSGRPPVSQPSPGNQVWPPSQPPTTAGSPAYRTSTAVQPAQPNMPLYR